MSETHKSYFQIVAWIGPKGKRKELGAPMWAAHRPLEKVEGGDAAYITVLVGEETHQDLFSCRKCYPHSEEIDNRVAPGA